MDFSLVIATMATSMEGYYGRILMFTLLLPRVFSEVSVPTITTIAYTGTTAIIDCPAQQTDTMIDWSGPPGSILYYYFPSNKFYQDNTGDKATRLSIAGNGKSLNLTDTRLSDSGLYSCRATDSTVYQGNNNLQVRIKASQPDITSSAPTNGGKVLATEDGALTINCTSRGGNPAPKVSLHRGSISSPELPGTSTVLPEGDTYTVMLSYTFTPTRQNDREQLVCRSYWPTPADEQDLQQKHVTLYLNLKPLETTVTQTASVVAGRDVSVECRITGCRPAANISWTYQQVTYVPSVTVTENTTMQTFTVVSVLKRPVTAADNGQAVQCRVAHVTGDLTETTALNVKFPPPSSSTNISGNKVIQATGSNILRLTCTTGSSNPASNITWTKGNSVISSNNQYTETGGQYHGTVRSQVLTLSPTRNDSGVTITCLVANGISSVPDSASVTLELHYSPLINNIYPTTETEGNNITLKCSADSKPPAVFTWKKGSDNLGQNNGTYDYNGWDFAIRNISRNNAGTYTCIANNGIPPSNEKNTTLRVLYPPDINVITVNTSVNSQSTNVTCEASGVPDQYTYERWIHTWNGHVVIHPEPLPSTKVLSLTNLTYAHSGVYTCGASNGIKEVSYGSGSLLVKSFPILTGESAETTGLKASGQLMRPIPVTFQYYSNAGLRSVQVHRINGTKVTIGEVHFRKVEIKLPLFISEITTAGTEASINITVTEENHFGAYEIVLTNEISSVKIPLVVQPLGPPETPFNINITVLDHQSVILTWKSGFPNGLNQTFVIQYSTDNSTWQNISQYGGLSFRHIHTRRIDSLTGSQLYFVRMVATNEKGESKPTDILTFETKESPPNLDASHSSSLTAGAAAGGAAAVLVIIAVVLFVIWRRKRNNLSGKTKDTGFLVDRSNENMGFEDRDEVVNRLYESAGSIQNETALTASARKSKSTGAEIHTNDKKPEVVYAMPAKPKGKKSETQNDKDLYALPDKTKGKTAEKLAKQKTEKNEKEEKKKKGKREKANVTSGDVYENAPSNVYKNSSTTQSGDSPYEDTDISSPQAPKKPPRPDGLVYADLEFKSPPKGRRENKIIGLEDRCEYTTIDLTKKAKPLPDSDDEGKNKH